MRCYFLLCLLFPFGRTVIASAVSYGWNNKLTAVLLEFHTNLGHLVSAWSNGVLEDRRKWCTEFCAMGDKICMISLAYHAVAVAMHTCYATAETCILNSNEMFIRLDFTVLGLNKKKIKARKLHGNRKGKKAKVKKEVELYIWTQF